MTVILQQTAIDVVNWELDDLHSNYPEGARSKKAYFPPSSLTLDFIKPERRYLYKKSVNRYPDQFWGEVIAYVIGCELGVTIPPTFAAFDSSDGTCGALIEWFYQDGLANFVPGGNFMQQIDPGYDRKRGLQHNFRWISAIGKTLSQIHMSGDDWRVYWGKALLFDALIGNTDRHQDNWGYLFLPREAGKPNAYLSPLFDHGTSLGHERYMHLVAGWKAEDFERYIARKSSYEMG